MNISSTYLSLSLPVLLAASLSAQSPALSFVTAVADNHIDVAYTPGLVPSNGMTVEAWMTYDDATAPNTSWHFPTIARHDVNPGAESWFLRVNSGNSGALDLQFACHNGSSLQRTTYTFTPGEFKNWTHVAAVYDPDNGQSEIYINGQLKVSSTISGSMRDTQGTLRIGNGDVANPGHEVWHGQLDEFRIWPFARTGGEILSTMNSTLFSVPHGVTFNFDSPAPYVDSSSGNIGMVTGTMTPVIGMNLPPVVLGAQAYGSPTTTCSNLMGTSVTGLSNNGNQDFAIKCIDASPGVNGALFLSLLDRKPAFAFLGLQIHIEVGLMIPTGFTSATSAGGDARLALPLPADPGLVGNSLFGQFVFLDTTCGIAPFGLSASEGLKITVQ